MFFSAEAECTERLKTSGGSVCLEWVFEWHKIPKLKILRLKIPEKDRERGIPQKAWMSSYCSVFPIQVVPKKLKS